MEFGWSAEESTYREELRAFLHEELPDEWWDFPTDRDLTTAEDKARTIEFNGKLADRGWLTPHWPAEYGGSRRHRVGTHHPGRGDVVAGRAARSAVHERELDWSRDHGRGDGGAEGVSPEADLRRGRHLVPGLLRA